MVEVRKLRSERSLKGYYFLFTGLEPSLTLLRPFISLLHQSCLRDGNDFGAVGGMNDFGREIEVLGENLPQFRSGHHRSHTCLVPPRTRGRRGGKLVTNNPSYGTGYWKDIGF
jgi:hypothetical protein